MMTAASIAGLCQAPKAEIDSDLTLAEIAKRRRGALLVIHRA